MNFIPKFIMRFFDYLKGDRVRATDFNSYLNLIVEASDHNSDALNKLINTGELAVKSSETSEEDNEQNTRLSILELVLPNKLNIDSIQAGSNINLEKNNATNTITISATGGGGGGGASTAADVSIVDEGEFYPDDNVESALQDIGNNIGGIHGMLDMLEGNQTTLIERVDGHDDILNTLSTIKIFPNSVGVYAGTLTSGTAADLSELGGTDVVVTEGTGANAIQIEVYFNGVTRASAITMYGNYNGGSGHYINIQLLNRITSQWNTVGSIGTSTTKQWYTFPIFALESYLNVSSQLGVRFIHPSNGTPTHTITLDYLDVSDGGPIGSTQIGASSVSLTPIGNISATNVATAINELDTEKLSIANKATGSEINTGTDDTKYVTAKAIMDSYIPMTRLDAYPVGAIYMSVVNTSPSILFGGTWVAFGTGRTLVGIDTSQTEFNTVEKTGGAKTHTILLEETPPHRHSSYNANASGSNPGTGTINTSATTNGFSGNLFTTLTGGSGGVTQPHNNLQPYITVYMWKRTA